MRRVGRKAATSTIDIMARPPYRLVLIEWLDSHRTDGWHHDEPATEGKLCRSVGWLIHDGEDAKTIAAHIADEDCSPPQRAGEMTIPTCSVKRIKRLVVPR
jgi:hypothetical protein